MPEARKKVAACAIGSDIYVFGGSAIHGNESASVFKLDTEANEWSTLPPMPIASSRHSASVLNGLVYIVGVGKGGNKVLRYDAGSKAWSTLADTLACRRGGACFVINGRFFAAGGSNSVTNMSVESYNVVSDEWEFQAPMHEGRHSFAVATILWPACPAEEQDLFDSLIDKAVSERWTSLNEG
jgi:N-acetylneuraminic acid mutarotase